MAVTDQQVLFEIQEHLIEDINSGASWSSGLWTTDEVISYLNQRQRQFMRDTLLLHTNTTVAHTPNTLRHSLPQDWIATRDLAFEEADGTFTEIPRGDNWELDNLKNDWPYNQAAAPPKLYSEGDQDTLVFETAPAANIPGLFHLLYVALSSALSNTGIAFTVPDEFVPCIKWGVMADMLGKVGRGQDPTRAGYAEQRYQEGVEAAKVMLRGFI